MVLGDNDHPSLFPFLPASFVKVKKSVVRHAREFAAEYGMVGQDIRVPIPFSPSPALFTSLGFLTTTLRTCDFNVPEGTLTLALMQTIVFLMPDGVSLIRVSLLPRNVIKKREFYRLFTSAFTHVDVPHVLFNVNALIDAGNVLENQMGAVPFLTDVALITLLSHGLYTVVAWIEHSQLDRSTVYYTHGIGFSCVTFALNTITGIMHVGDPTIESSVPDLPVCFHVWIHLAVTQICFPHSNFFGHLIGISTGLIRAFCPGPFLWVRKKVTGFFSFVTQQRLCNGTNDERALTVGRRKTNILQHLCCVAVAFIYHLYRGRPRKQ